MREWLTTEQVAEILHVTPARVRQLVTEGKLPAPVEFGPRANLWQRSELEAYQVRISAGRDQVTGQSSLMADATMPLKRTRDVLFRPLPNRDFQAHVRVWEGEASEGLRRVVVMSRPFDHGYADTFIESIAAAIDSRFLGGGGRNAVWFEAYMNGHGVGNPFELSNLVMTHGRIDRRAFQPTPYANPIWISRDLEELDRLTGESVEWWPPQAYTMANITRWQRDRGMFTVEDDRYELRPVAEAVEVLRGTSALSPRFEIVHRVLQAIAPAMDIRDRLFGQPWDDGTVPAPSGQWPRTMAARLVPYRLGDDQRELVRTVLVGGVEPDRETLLEDLREWLRDVDAFGEHPDEIQAGALLAVLGVLDRELELDPWLDKAIPRVFEVVGPSDRRFLDGMTWLTGSDIDRVRRRLHAELGYDVAVEYATLPGGSQVARAVTGDRFAVMWPESGGGEITPDTVLVGDTDVGDRPVYLEQDGRFVGLLNLSPHSFREWTWGFRGGSDSLASAIVHHLIEGFPDASVSLAYVEEALTHTRGHELRIPVTDLTNG